MKGVAAVAALVAALTTACANLPEHPRPAGSAASRPVGLAASASVAEVLAVRPGDTVTTLDGEPVTGAEVLRSAETVRARVISSSGGDLGAGFWDRGAAGSTPRDRLRAEAVRLAVRDKARRIWARQAGLLADPGEQGFQRELAAENRRRAEAAAAGRPLPGVPSYDQYTYAGVRAAELDSALSKIYASTLDLDERRLRAEYRRMAGPGALPYARARESVRTAVILREYGRALDERARG